jgi:DNA-binding PadR family transcriptional regulator
MTRSQIVPPLSSSVTYILLALAQRDLHGYGIMQEIKSLSSGVYKLGPGTLYDNLRALLAAGIVSEFMENEGSVEGRRMYRLTQSGLNLLDAELRRLHGVLQAGKKRLRVHRLGEAQ